MLPGKRQKFSETETVTTDSGAFSSAPDTIQDGVGQGFIFIFPYRLAFYKLREYYEQSMEKAIMLPINSSDPKREFSLRPCLRTFFPLTFRKSLISE